MCSAAADGDDDLDPVAVVQAGLCEPASGDDLAVALQREAPLGEVECGHESRAVERPGGTPWARR